jgi:hypothetical protein
MAVLSTQKSAKRFEGIAHLDVLVRRVRQALASPASRGASVPISHQVEPVANPIAEEEFADEPDGS